MIAKHCVMRAARRNVAVEKFDSHLVVLAPDDFAKTAHTSVFRKQQQKPIGNIRRRINPQPSSGRRKIAHCAVGKRLQLEYGYSSRLMHRLPGTASSLGRHVAPAPETLLVRVVYSRNSLYDNRFKDTFPQFKIDNVRSTGRDGLPAIVARARGRSMPPSVAD